MSQGVGPGDFPLADTLKGLKNYFDVIVWELKDSHDSLAADSRLAVLAESLLDLAGRHLQPPKATDKPQRLRRAKEAVKLLESLGREKEKELVLPSTRRVLWTALMRGWLSGEDLEQEEELAQTIREQKFKGKELDTWEALVRDQTEIEYGIDDRIVRLIAGIELREGQYELPTAIAKLSQTLPKKMPPRHLVLACRLLKALGKPYSFDGIEDVCVALLDKVNKTVEGMRKLSPTLSIMGLHSQNIRLIAPDRIDVTWYDAPRSNERDQELQRLSAELAKVAANARAAMEKEGLSFRLDLHILVCEYFYGWHHRDTRDKLKVLHNLERTV